MLIFATSDKGGTGRSVTSSNIMYRRALQGGDVCYLDFDFGSPTAGTIFNIPAAARGTLKGGLHSYLQGKLNEPEQLDVWSESDRLRHRPLGAGRLVLLPGDADSGDFSSNRAVVQRCVSLFLRLEEEFDLCLIDLSAGRTRSRVSTCFLVDDYFTRFSSPAELVPELVSAARETGLEIDYLARESGCAHADGVELARLVEGRLVVDPPPDTNASRPLATEVGWLCNGQRSPATDATEAMEAIQRWVPPVQNAARRHSIFLDVELWDESNGRRVWSCPFLAAVWQLLRLGMLRHEGKDVMVAGQFEGEFPEDWDEIPAVIQLNPVAKPFSAYRTLSILSTRFLPIEHAVRTVLSQVAVDRDVLDQVITRSRGEGVSLPLELVDRIDYVFAGISASRPQ
jgi:hypothetical protein